MACLMYLDSHQGYRTTRLCILVIPFVSLRFPFLFPASERYDSHQYYHQNDNIDVFCMHDPCPGLCLSHTHAHADLVFQIRVASYYAVFVIGSLGSCCILHRLLFPDLGSLQRVRDRSEIWKSLERHDWRPVRTEYMVCASCSYYVVSVLARIISRRPMVWFRNDTLRSNALNRLEMICAVSL